MANKKDLLLSYGMSGIKLNSGIFIITGGAIKLTATMQERTHTAIELIKIEQVRRFLIDNGIVDETGFEDYGWYFWHYRPKCDKKVFFNDIFIRY